MVLDGWMDGCGWLCGWLWLVNDARNASTAKDISSHLLQDSYVDRIVVFMAHSDHISNMSHCCFISPLWLISVEFVGQLHHPFKQPNIAGDLPSVFRWNEPCSWIYQALERSPRDGGD